MAIIMHELFHCLMNREHYNDRKAIMNEMLNMDDWEFLMNLERYLGEMFDPRIVAKMPQRPAAELIQKQNYGAIGAGLRKILGK